MVSPNRKAFTLVELLTVVAIIALLIGILIPSVTSARKQAYKAECKTQLYNLSQGIDLFRNDFGYYPSSEPQQRDGTDVGAARTGYSDTTHVIQGAHRLAMAMVGRDQQGCPARRVSAVAAPDSIKGIYYTDDGSFDDTPVTTLSNWGNVDQKTARKGPYVETKGINIVKDETLDLNSDENTNDFLSVLCDRYDKRPENAINSDTDYENHSVILYYAANQRGKSLYSGSTPSPTGSANIYYFQDNKRIVLSGTSGGNQSSWNGGYTVDNFYDFIEDKNAIIGNTHRPYNSDTFLLISRGWDGIYGTEDDITNFSK